jgi:hypothetical protein
MRVYQTESIAKLADALAKAQAETQHASKSAENPFFKSKYADLPAIIDAARPHLTKHGLSVTQPTDFDETGIFVITQISHSSGEWVRGYYPVRPTKNDPQGVGSALTYARRYSYQSLVGIATSADDDDGNAASVPNGNGAKPPEPKPNGNGQKAEYKPSDPLRPYKDEFVVPAPIKPDGTLDFDTFTADLETCVLRSKTNEELSLWNRANAKTMRAMEKERPELFKALGEEFRKRGQQLM